jgi:hypothetical protein
MGRTFSTLEKEAEYIKGFSGKAKMKEVIKTSRRRYEDNIKMDLGGDECWSNMEWINVAQDRYK